MHDYQDIPRIYTGIAQMSSCFVYCALFGAGNRDVTRCFRLAVGLILQCLFLQVTGSLPLFLWIPCMG
ncbi:MAG: ATP-binding protein, partial [Lachnospiraceae bacterium]|nr:ATP-binding protein [Lachnospiraceae bacterium]